MNKCNCIKWDVCQHHANIIAAVRGITELQIGGVSPIYEKITKLVEQSCMFREQNKRRLKKERDAFIPMKEGTIEDFKQALKKKKSKRK